MDLLEQFFRLGGDSICFTKGTSMSREFFSCHIMVEEFHFRGEGNTREAAYTAAVKQCLLKAAA